MTKFFHHYTCIDPSVICGIAAGDRDMLREIIVYFIDNHADYLIQICSSVNSGVREEMKFQAHRTKGLYKIIGATGMAESAAQLEQLYLAGNLEEAAVVFRTLEENGPLAIAELTLMLADLNILPPDSLLRTP
ncbi:MAG: Hpt domain-containing protein [Chitinophagia bacterium]|nr:Hpt domain-containing protein [Chitinophagia bacterium]